MSRRNGSGANLLRSISHDLRTPLTLGIIRTSDLEP